MEACMLLVHVSEALLKLFGNSRERLFARTFQVRVTTLDTEEVFDMRDILRSKELKKCFVNLGLQELDSSSRFDRLFKMNDLYDETLKEIECSTSDTFEQHTARVLRKIQLSEHYEDFMKECEPVKLFDLIVPYEYEIIRDVFRLTSEWCTELKISLNDEKVVKLLSAMDYLDIDNGKEVDIFLTDNGNPLHLRIKTINLFCINFVFLLKMSNMLAEYQSFFNGQETNPEKAFIAKVIKRIYPLSHFICLLQFEMARNNITHLFLGFRDLIFVNEMHYETNSKVILLMNKHDLSEKSSLIINLIEEFNTINRPFINNRLYIPLPLVRCFGYRLGRPGKVPFDLDIQIERYIGFVWIFREITELCIHNTVYSESNFNLVALNKYVALEGDPDVYMEGIITKLVDAAIRILPGLSSLLIQGYNKFPEALIPKLRKTSLKAFGVLGLCSKVDYIVIYQLFKEECALKNSITVFFGHFRALQFISNFLPENKIRNAKVSNMLSGMSLELFEDEKMVAEQIKSYFVNELLSEKVATDKKVEIETLEYLDSMFVQDQAKDYRVRPHMPMMPVESFSRSINGLEILENWAFCRIIGVFEDSIRVFLSDLHRNKPNGISHIKTFDLIMNSCSDYSNISYENWLEGFMSNGSCLTLSCYAHLFLRYRPVLRLKDSYARFISCMARQLVFLPEKNIIFKLVLRLKEDEIVEAEKIREMLFEYFWEELEERISDEDKLSRFIVEKASYKSKKMDALASVHL
ncbi:hypothetical protein ENBRE01_0417 [Enteropsectra breve]|nr:hypothetical protein ENBRE01_0417 [Enteropsectra breve]